MTGRREFYPTELSAHQNGVATEAKEASEKDQALGGEKKYPVLVEAAAEERTNTEKKKRRRVPRSAAAEEGSGVSSVNSGVRSPSASLVISVSHGMVRTPDRI
jgi:hypothetical protein